MGAALWLCFRLCFFTTESAGAWDSAWCLIPAHCEFVFSSSASNFPPFQFPPLVNVIHRLLHALILSPNIYEELLCPGHGTSPGLSLCYADPDGGALVPPYRRAARALGLSPLPLLAPFLPSFPFYRAPSGRELEREVGASKHEVAHSSAPKGPRSGGVAVMSVDGRRPAWHFTRDVRRVESPSAGT